MSNGIRVLPARKDFSVESEEGQAYFRFRMAIGVLVVYVLAMAVFDPGDVTRALFSVLGYAGFAYAWVWVVARGALVSSTRQWAALVLDHVVFSASLAWGGLILAPLLWVPITISVGHGLRFGPNRGIAAALVGGLCVLVATSVSTAWSAPLVINIGLTVAAVVTPIYVIRLVRTIEKQRLDAERKALELEETARTDGLTGLLNRRGFERAVLSVGLDGRFAEPVGVLYVDLDGFKAVNDTLGHDAGDAILQRVARAMRSAVRTADDVARLGGDEFALLLKAPGDLASTRALATKLLESIRGIAPEGRPDLAISGSIGLCLAAAGEVVTDVVRTADKRMYVAKRAGKDRVVDR